MKPAAFDYYRPTSVTEALGMLSESDGEAKVLAGGQSLIAMLNLRMATPTLLIDVNDLAELDRIEASEGSVRIGALTRHRTVETASLPPGLRILHDAARHVGHVPIRTRGTFGGSMCHADPSAEFPLVARTLDAEFRLRSVRGERVVGASDFFHSFFETACAPDELLVEVRFPQPPAGVRSSFMEMATRHGDFALVAVAALVAVDEDGRATWARIGLGGVADTPVRSTEAEDALLGRRLDEAIADASRAATTGLSPIGDLHASSELRSELVRVLVTRALSSMVRPVATSPS